MLPGCVQGNSVVLCDRWVLRGCRTVLAEYSVCSGCCQWRHKFGPGFTRVRKLRSLTVERSSYRNTMDIARAERMSLVRKPVTLILIWRLSRPSKERG